MAEKKTYAEKLKDPRWQKKRLEIFQRDKFRCQYCNDDKITLHVHHKKYSGDPWESLDKDLQTVCEQCHLILTKHKSDFTSNRIFKLTWSDGDFTLVYPLKGRLYFSSYEEKGDAIMSFPINENDARILNIFIRGTFPNLFK